MDKEIVKEKLWPVLVETAHSLVLYNNHKAYIRGTILPENPDITVTELAAKFSMPLGEALVILFELAEDKKSDPQPTQTTA